MLSLLVLYYFPMTSDEMIKELDPVFENQHFAYSYKAQPPGDTSYELYYKRTTDNHFLRVVLGQGQSQSDVDNYIFGSTSGNGGRNPEISPSNIPLGDRSFVIRPNDEVFACADGFFVGTYDSTAQRNSDSKRDARLLEAVSRVALSEMIGSLVNRGGRPTGERSNTSQHTHSTYEPLSVIVKRQRLKPTIGEWLDRCTIEIKKHRIELSLASDFVLIDGKPFTMEAFVARKHGDWMIPTRVLKQKGVEVL